MSDLVGLLVAGSVFSIAVAFALVAAALSSMGPPGGGGHNVGHLVHLIAGVVGHDGRTDVWR